MSLIDEVRDRPAAEGPAAGASAGASAPALRVLDLSKRYGANLALAPTSLDFLPGRVHVLFGENGAGKSTLISMIAGANEPSGGTVQTPTHHGVFRSVVIFGKYEDGATSNSDPGIAAFNGFVASVKMATAFTRSSVRSAVRFG